MSAGKIRVVLDIDDKGFHAKMERAGKVTRDFTKELKRSQKSLKNIEKGVTGLLPRLRDYAITASILKGGISNLAHVTVGWQKTLLDNIGNVERMTFLLKGMSTASTDAARSLEATQNLKYMLDQAERAPFSLAEMTNSFVKFKSVGLDPTDGSLQSLNDAVASFGGNDQILHRASVAIQQMAGKGVISMEELRQQLGEAVPNAIKLMARSMGMSYQELVSNISKGRVEAKSALARMFGEFERTMGGSSARMMETWSGMLAKLSTRWLKFQLAVGDSGYFDEAKKALQGVLDAMTPQRLAEIAAGIGEALTMFIHAVKATVSTLYDLRKVISFVVKAFGAMFIIHKMRGMLLATSLALKTMTLSVGTTTASIRAFSLSAAVGTTATTAWTAAAWSLKTAMTALGGPIGLILAGISAAAIAWDVFGNKAEKAADKVKNSIQSINDEDLRVLESHYNDMLKKQERFQKEFEDAYKRRGKNMYGIDDSDGKWIEKARKNLQEVSQQVLLAKDDFDKAMQQMGITDGDIAVKELERSLRDQMSQFRAHYAERANIAHDAYESDSIDKKAFHDKQTQLIAEYYSNQIGLYKEKMAELVTQMSAISDVNGQERKVLKLKAQIKYINEQLLKINAQKDRAVEELKKGPTLTDGTVGSGVRNLEKYIQKLTTKMMEYSGTLSGVNTELKQFDYLVSQGAFGKLGSKFTQADLDRARYLLKVVTDMKAAVKEDKQVQTINKQIAKSYAKIAEEVDTLNGKLDSNVTTKTTFADSLTKQIKGMIATLPEGSAAIDKLKKNLVELQLSASNVDLLRGIVSTKNEVIGIEQDMMTERERLADEYRRKVESVALMIQQTEGLSADVREDRQRQLYGFMDSLNKKFAYDQRTEMAKLNEQWQDFGKQMNGAVTGWANTATDAIVEFVKTGKSSFKDLADSIISDILRIMLQKAIVGPLFNMLDFSGAGSSAPVTKSANGNIMTSMGPMNLNKYANGGVANSPQVSVFGEGRKPEAYVPLPDGRTIPVTMQGGQQGAMPVVNVINQTGVQADVQQSSRFDGEKMILDVVMKAVAKPGAFRDGMKRSVK